jgi:chromosome segregation ATPase
VTDNRRFAAPLRTVLGLRHRVADRVGRMIDWRIVHPLEGNRLYQLYGSVDDHQRQLAEVQEARHDLGRRLGDLERRYNEVERLQRWSANELERIIPQVAAQEAQLETLREKLAAVPAAERPEIDESRSLIDEIRREHSQIRVRLTAVAQYEDRLRKLEDNRVP